MDAGMNNPVIQSYRECRWKHPVSHKPCAQNGWEWNSS